MTTPDLRRGLEWLEVEWTLAALGSTWRRVLWAPVVIPVSILVTVISMVKEMCHGDPT